MSLTPEEAAAFAHLRRVMAELETVAKYLKDTDRQVLSGVALHLAALVHETLIRAL